MCSPAPAARRHDPVTEKGEEAGEDAGGWTRERGREEAREWRGNERAYAPAAAMRCSHAPAEPINSIMLVASRNYPNPSILKGFAGAGP